MRDNLAGSLEAEEEVNRALSSHSRVPGQLTGESGHSKSKISRADSPVNFSLILNL